MGNSTEKSTIIDLQPNVVGFKNNDPKTLKKVYLEVYPKARAYVLNNRGNEAMAKDVFQEAFIACWRNIKEGRLKEDSNLEAYLFTIAKNKWLDHLRSEKFRKTTSMNGITIMDTQTTAEEDHHAIYKEGQSVQEVMAQLGKACQNLLKGFYFDRKDMEELATEMGITAASARNKKYRCMQQLRTLIKKRNANG